MTIIANTGNLVNENDVEVKFDGDPTETLVLNCASDITYKQIFLEIVQFVHNNNANKPFLEYPRLYLNAKNPKCNNDKHCEQCYLNLNSKNTSRAFCLCASKRRQIGNQLFDVGQKRQCVAESLSTTAGKLFIPDKLLIKESNRYSMKINWFANVYSFLQWQQEVVQVLLQNLVRLNNDEIEQSKFLHKFDVLTILHSYLDELIEYLVLYYCCFDTQIWVAVFYPFIEAAIGTLQCEVLFAESNVHSKKVSVKSLCTEALKLDEERQTESRERCLEEVKGLSIFKRLLYDVYKYNHDISIDAKAYDDTTNDHDPFVLTHTIQAKLKETVNNIKTQLLIHQMTGRNAYTSNTNNDAESIDKSANREAKNSDTKENNEDGLMTFLLNRDRVRIKVPSFIRLFVIKRIIDKYIGNTSNIQEKKQMIGKVTNVLAENNDAQIKLKAFNVIMRLVNDGIAQYMNKWYHEKEQANIIEMIFKQIILTTFAAQYNKLTTYVTNIDDKKCFYQIMVFNLEDVMCCIFQYLPWFEDLFHCSLVNSHWLFYAWNINSIYYADLSKLLYLTSKYDNNDDNTVTRTWQRLLNAKWINITTPGYGGSRMKADTFSKLPLHAPKIASNLLSIRRLSLFFLHKYDQSMLVFWQLLRPIIKKNNTKVVLTRIELSTDEINVLHDTIAKQNLKIDKIGNNDQIRMANNDQVTRVIADFQDSIGEIDEEIDFLQDYTRDLFSLLMELAHQGSISDARIVSKNVEQNCHNLITASQMYRDALTESNKHLESFQVKYILLFWCEILRYLF